MLDTTGSFCESPPRKVGGVWFSFLARRWVAYLKWREQRAAIAILRSLDDRILKDLGLYRGEIESIVTGGRDERLRR